mgnify:CR=1 FL=1
MPTELFQGAALITGASSGIGAAFAHALAARGMGLLLTARRADRLEALAAELRTTYGVQVALIPADLSERADLEHVAEHAAAHAQISILVNNAGFGVAGAFPEADPPAQLAMIAVHAAAPVRLARAVLPGMIARGRGAVINVSSIAAFVTQGGSALYSASKLFLNGISQNLNAELRGSGVEVQALCPGFTLTEFHAAVRGGSGQRPPIPEKLWMTSEQIVEASLKALGTGRVIVVPGAYYRWIVFGLGTPLGRALVLLRRWLRRRVRRGET